MLLLHRYFIFSYLFLMIPGLAFSGENPNALVVYTAKKNAEHSFLVALHALKREEVDKAEQYLTQAKSLGFLELDYSKKSPIFGYSPRERFEIAEQKLLSLKRTPIAEVQSVIPIEQEMETTGAVEQTSIESIPVLVDYEMEQEKIEAEEKVEEVNTDAQRAAEILFNLNERFSTRDQSKVKDVFVNDTGDLIKVVIDDPQRKEHIIIKGNPKSVLNRTIVPFTYNIAIKYSGHNQFRTKQDFEDHSFAKMLDYVIQLLGDTQYDHKTKRSDDQKYLYAKLTRKNLKTSEKIRAIAEYAYISQQQKQGMTHTIYHRLLRRRLYKDMPQEYKDFLLGY